MLMRRLWSVLRSGWQALIAHLRYYVNRSDKKGGSSEQKRSSGEPDTVQGGPSSSNDRAKSGEIRETFSTENGKRADSREEEGVCVMSSYKLPPVLQQIEKIGGKVFTSGAYNLNLFGIRSPNRNAGTFDDLMGCAYKETEDGPFRVHWWPATTDPGVYWLENPMKVEGCAALVADRQYRGVYSVDLHAGKYRALCQRNGPVSVYRDGTRDAVLNYDPSTIQEGMFGINLHASHQVGDGSGDSTVVGKWSAGCNVHATESGFRDMMALVDKSIEVHPTWTKFTYTLLNQWW